MPESDNPIARRSFVEKVALAAGIAAGAGTFLENLNPEIAQAATSPAPSATDLMNSGAFGWNLLADGPANAPASLTTNPNILMTSSVFRAIG